MPVCDTHDLLWPETKQDMARWMEAYLLVASFCQSTVVQEALVDQVMEKEKKLSREVCRREIERKQGQTPWLICEICIPVFGLSRPDEEAAREKAKSWWRDNSTPGHMPGKESPDYRKDFDLLIGLTSNKSPRIRARAVELLGKQDKKDAVLLVHYLIDSLEDKEKLVREMTAKALAELTGESFGQDSARWNQWLEEKEKKSSS